MKNLQRSRNVNYKWKLRAKKAWKTRRHNDYWRDFWARFWVILYFVIAMMILCLIGYLLATTNPEKEILEEKLISQVIAKQVKAKPVQDLLNEKVKIVEAKKPPETPKVWNAQEYAKNKTIEIWGIQEWNAHYKLVMKESGWRNTAKNPRSTAFGYYQFLDGTWQSVGFQKTYNPKTQIDAGTTYILQRYGSPSQALQFHYRNNYY